MGEQPLHISLCDVDGHSIATLPADSCALHNSSDEVWAKLLSVHVHIGQRSEEAATDDFRLRLHLDVPADVKREGLALASAPFLAEAHMRFYISGSRRLCAQNLSHDLVVIWRLVCIAAHVVVLDNRFGNAIELLIPTLSLPDVMLDIQGLREQGWKLGELLLEAIWDVRPLEALLQHRGQVFAISLANVTLVKLLLSDGAAHEILIGPELRWHFHFIVDACEHLVQVPATHTASLNRFSRKACEMRVCICMLDKAVHSCKVCRVGLEGHSPGRAALGQREADSEDLCSFLENLPTRHEGRITVAHMWHDPLTVDVPDLCLPRFDHQLQHRISDLDKLAIRLVHQR